ncbi:hypothetical protein SAMN05428969_1052 [Devosia sp. YR412]|uniref:hypothetical protein n=1 Tax=Devosia sp. YR412 TaxID=1881030 RepID=UPI0008D1E5B8|nr:hypothetical protein [Devosia sp. YR412]SEP82022.1 hypothetical protein SAMN05428969_1052 [Devosia sp. YR412]
MAWGILSPDAVISQRRQQNLELGAAVRYFNDAAVPGLGGMWFAMPVVWSVVAVSIAEKLQQPALPVGNAIEALAMSQAKDGPIDRRVRGKRKLQGLTDWSFEKLRKRGTYVVQPIRMAMVQPLVALGFAQGSRYGAFQLHTAGKRMLELPIVEHYRDTLLAWANGKNPRGLSEVIAAISPTEDVRPEVRKLILARLIDGEDQASTRRRNLVSLGTGPSSQQLENTRPPPGVDDDHWRDLRGGAAFMEIRDAALSVLDRLEQRLLKLRDDNEAVRLSEEQAASAAEEEIEALGRLTDRLGDRVRGADEPVSKAFLAELASLDPPHLVRRLAERDGTVIRWHGDQLRLGAAAGELKRNDELGEEGIPPKDDVFAPQLFRLYNLHCLATELSGKANPGVTRHEGIA